MLIASQTLILSSTRNVWSLWVYVLQYMASNHEFAMYNIDKGYFKAVRNLMIYREAITNW